jgi:hypothetical protein
MSAVINPVGSTDLPPTGDGSGSRVPPAARSKPTVAPEPPVQFEARRQAATAQLHPGRTEQPAAQPATAPSDVPTPKPPSRGRLAWRSRLGLSFAALAIIAGWVLPTERYVNPQYGIGYGLGIIGGSMMLALLIYPLRKRKPSLAFLGSISGWFRVHMVLGVVGPLAILYHSNFRLGATNSNVALTCMLIVAGSGLVGRYLYSRIHHGLYGRRASLNELARDAERLRQHSGELRLLPGLMDEIERSEKHIGAPSTMLVRPFLAAWRHRSELRRVESLLHQAVSIAAARSAVVGEQRERLTQAAMRYVEARLAAARRVAEFESSERLFAAWHILHMPLFIMLVVVGTVHVIAVHLY